MFEPIELPIQLTGLEKFEQQLKTRVEDPVNAIKSATIKLEADTKALTSQLEGLSEASVLITPVFSRGALPEFENTELNVDVQIDDSGLTAFENRLKGIAEAEVTITPVFGRGNLPEYDDLGLRVEVSVDDSRLTDLNAHIDSKISHIKELNNTPVNIKVNDFDIGIDADDLRYTVKVDGDVSQLKNSIESFSDGEVRVTPVLGLLEIPAYEDQIIEANVDLNDDAVTKFLAKELSQTVQVDGDLKSLESSIERLGSNIEFNINPVVGRVEIPTYSDIGFKIAASVDETQLIRLDNQLDSIGDRIEFLNRSQIDIRAKDVTVAIDQSDLKQSINVDADIERAQAKIAELSNSVVTISPLFGRTEIPRYDDIELRVNPIFNTGAIAEFKAQNAAHTIKIDADITSIRAKIRELSGAQFNLTPILGRVEIPEYKDQHFNVSVTVDDAPLTSLNRYIAATIAHTRELSDSEISITPIFARGEVPKYENISFVVRAILDDQAVSDFRARDLSHTINIDGNVAALTSKLKAISDTEITITPIFGRGNLPEYEDLAIKIDLSINDAALKRFKEQNLIHTVNIEGDATKLSAAIAQLSSAVEVRIIPILGQLSLPAVESLEVDVDGDMSGINAKIQSLRDTKISITPVFGVGNLPEYGDLGFKIDVAVNDAPLTNLNRKIDSTISQVRELNDSQIFLRAGINLDSAQQKLSAFKTENLRQSIRISADLTALRNNFEEISALEVSVTPVFGKIVFPDFEALRVEVKPFIDDSLIIDFKAQYSAHTIKVDADLTPLQSQLADFRETEILVNPTFGRGVLPEYKDLAIQVDVLVDSASLTRLETQLGVTEERLAELRNYPISLTIGLHLDSARESLSAFKGEFHRHTVRVDGDLTPLRSRLEEFSGVGIAITPLIGRGVVPEYEDISLQVTTFVNDDSLTALNRHIDSKIDHIDELNEKEIILKAQSFDLGIEGQIDKIKELQQSLASLENSFQVGVGIDAESFSSQEIAADQGEGGTFQSRILADADRLVKSNAESIILLGAINQGIKELGLKMGQLRSPESLDPAKTPAKSEPAAAELKALVEVSQSNAELIKEQTKAVEETKRSLAGSFAGNIFRGFVESAGREVFLGTSEKAKERLRKIGNTVTEKVSQTGQTALARSLGFQDAKGLQDQIARALDPDALFKPFREAAVEARKSAVQAAASGGSSVGEFWRTFEVELAARIKKSAVQQGKGAATRAAAAVTNIIAPAQGFRRDVSIEKAKTQAKDIQVELTEHEIQSIMKAEKEIIVGNAGFFPFDEGKTGTILEPLVRRFFEAEFVGLDSPGATKLVRGESLPDDLIQEFDNPALIETLNAFGVAVEVFDKELGQALKSIKSGQDINDILVDQTKSDQIKGQIATSAIQAARGGTNLDLPQQLAKINAIRELRPDLKVKFLGFSGGGSIGDDLVRAGAVDRGATIGTPFYQAPAIPNARGGKDSQFNMFGVDSDPLQEVVSSNIQDFANSGLAHALGNYLNSPEVRKWVVDQLNLQLSDEQIQFQGVDPSIAVKAPDARQKGVRKTINALNSISTADAGVGQIQKFIGSDRVKNLKPQESIEVFEEVFASLDDSVKGFETITGDRVVDDARERIQGLVDHYKIVAEDIADQPEKLIKVLNKALSEIKSETEAAIRAQVAVPKLPIDDPVELSDSKPSKSEGDKYDLAIANVQGQILQLQEERASILSNITNAEKLRQKFEKSNATELAQVQNRKIESLNAEVLEIDSSIDQAQLFIKEQKKAIEAIAALDIKESQNVQGPLSGDSLPTIDKSPDISAASGTKPGSDIPTIEVNPEIEIVNKIDALVDLANCLCRKNAPATQIPEVATPQIEVNPEIEVNIPEIEVMTPEIEVPPSAIAPSAELLALPPTDPVDIPESKHALAIANVEGQILQLQEERESVLAQIVKAEKLSNALGKGATQELAQVQEQKKKALQEQVASIYSSIEAAQAYIFEQKQAIEATVIPDIPSPDVSPSIAIAPEVQFPESKEAQAIAAVEKQILQLQEERKSVLSEVTQAEKFSATLEKSKSKQLVQAQDEKIAALRAEIFEINSSIDAAESFVQEQRKVLTEKAIAPSESALAPTEIADPVQTKQSLREEKKAELSRQLSIQSKVQDQLVKSESPLAKEQAKLVRVTKKQLNAITRQEKAEQIIERGKTDIATTQKAIVETTAMLKDKTESAVSTLFGIEKNYLETKTHASASTVKAAFLVDMLQSAGNAVNGLFTAVKTTYGVIQQAETAFLKLDPSGASFVGKRALQIGGATAATALFAPGAFGAVTGGAAQLGQLGGAGLGGLVNQGVASVLPNFPQIGFGISEALSTIAPAILGGAGAVGASTGAAIFTGHGVVKAGERLAAALPGTDQSKELAKSTQKALSATKSVVDKATKALVSVEIEPILISADGESIPQTKSPSTAIVPSSKPTSTFVQARPPKEFTAQPDLSDFFGMIPKVEKQFKTISQGFVEIKQQQVNLVSTIQKTNQQFKTAESPIDKGVSALRVLDESRTGKEAIKAEIAANRKSGAITSKEQNQLTSGLNVFTKQEKEARAFLQRLAKQYRKSGKDIGVFVQQGLAQGMSQGDAEKAAHKLVKDVILAAERDFGIASPSKVFRAIGKFVVKGLAIGLGDDAATTASGKMADGIIAIAKTRIGSGAKGILDPLARGINDGLSEIVPANRPSIVDKAKKEPSLPDAPAKKGFGIASASKAAGRLVVKGLAVGLGDDTAIAAASKMSDGIITSARQKLVAAAKSIIQPFVNQIGGTLGKVKPLAAIDRAISSIDRLYVASESRLKKTATTVTQSFQKIQSGIRSIASLQTIDQTVLAIDKIYVASKSKLNATATSFTQSFKSIQSGIRSFNPLPALDKTVSAIDKIYVASESKLKKAAASINQAFQSIKSGASKFKPLTVLDKTVSAIDRFYVASESKLKKTATSVTQSFQKIKSGAQSFNPLATLDQTVSSIDRFYVASESKLKKTATSVSQSFQKVQSGVRNFNPLQVLDQTVSGIDRFYVSSESKLKSAGQNIVKTSRGIQFRVSKTFSQKTAALKAAIPSLDPRSAITSAKSIVGNLLSTVKIKLKSGVKSVVSPFVEGVQEEANMLNAKKDLPKPESFDRATNIKQDAVISSNSTKNYVQEFQELVTRRNQLAKELEQRIEIGEVDPTDLQETLKMADKMVAEARSRVKQSIVASRPTQRSLFTPGFSDKPVSLNATVGELADKSLIGTNIPKKTFTGFAGGEDAYIQELDRLLQKRREVEAEMKQQIQTGGFAEPANEKYLSAINNAISELKQAKLAVSGTLTPVEFTPFEGVDDALEFDANTTIKELREQSQRLNQEFIRASGEFESVPIATKPALVFTPFDGVDDALEYKANTTIRELREQSERIGKEFIRASSELDSVINLQKYDFVEVNKLRFADENREPTVRVPDQDLSLFSSRQAPNARPDPLRGGFTETASAQQKKATVGVSETEIKKQVTLVERLKLLLKGELKLALNTKDAILKSEAFRKSVNGIKNQIDIKIRAPLIKPIQKDLDFIKNTLNNIRELAVTAFAGFIGFQAFDLLLQQGIQAKEIFKEFQAAEIRINLSAGGVEEGAEKLKFIRSESDRLGLNFLKTADSYSFLAAQVQGGQFEGSLDPLFTSLSETATALQFNEEKAQRLFTAFGQIFGKGGKLSAEEVRQQLGELGIKADIFREALGFSKDELQEFNKQLDTGKLVLTQESVQKITDTLKKNFGPGLAEASQSLQALENRFVNAANKLRIAFVENALPALTTGLNIATDAFKLLADNSGIVLGALQLLGVTGVGVFAGKLLDLNNKFKLLGKAGLFIARFFNLSLPIALGKSWLAADTLDKKMQVMGTGALKLGAGLLKTFGTGALILAATNIAIDGITSLTAKSEEARAVTTQFESSWESLRSAFEKPIEANLNFNVNGKPTDDFSIDEDSFGGKVTNFISDFTGGGIIPLAKGQTGIDFQKVANQEIGLAKEIAQNAENDRGFLGTAKIANRAKDVIQGKGLFNSTRLITELKDQEKQSEIVGDIADKSLDKFLNTVAQKGGVENLTPEEFQSARTQFGKMEESARNFAKTAGSNEVRDTFQGIADEIAVVNRMLNEGGDESQRLANKLAEAQAALDTFDLSFERDKSGIELDAALAVEGGSSAFDAEQKKVADTNALLEERIGLLGAVVSAGKAKIDGALFDKLPLSEQTTLIKEQAKDEQDLYALQLELSKSAMQAKIDASQRVQEELEREYALMEQLIEQQSAIAQLATTRKFEGFESGINDQEVAITRRFVDAGFEGQGQVAFDTELQSRALGIDREQLDFLEAQENKVNGLNTLFQKQALAKKKLVDLTKAEKDAPTPEREQQLEQQIEQQKTVVLQGEAEIQRQKRDLEKEDIKFAEQYHKNVFELYKLRVQREIGLQKLQTDQTIQAQTVQEQVISESLEHSKIKAESLTKSLDKQREVLESFGTVRVAAESLSLSVLDGRLNEVREASEIFTRIREGSDTLTKEQTKQLKTVLEQLTGTTIKLPNFAGTDKSQAILDAQKIEQNLLLKRQQIEDEIAKAKFDALNRELQMAKALLALDLQRQQIAAQQSVRDAQLQQSQAQIGFIEAQGGRQQAEFDLQEAQQTGSTIDIQRAELALDQAEIKEELSFNQVTAASFGVQDAQSAASQTATLIQNAMEAGALDSAAKLSQFLNEERTRERSQTLELIDFGSKNIADIKESGATPAQEKKAIAQSEQLLKKQPLAIPATELKAIETSIMGLAKPGAQTTPTPQIQAPRLPDRIETIEQPAITQFKDVSKVFGEMLAKPLAHAAAVQDVLKQTTQLEGLSQPPQISGEDSVEIDQAPKVKASQGGVNMGASIVDKLEAIRKAVENKDLSVNIRATGAKVDVRASDGDDSLGLMGA